MDHRRERVMRPPRNLNTAANENLPLNENPLSSSLSGIAPMVRWAVEVMGAPSIWEVF
jgi:hypothetical protein